jgi:AbrB family looped-hinge helix DNA binding protein
VAPALKVQHLEVSSCRGKVSTMTTTIDSAGRLVIPKTIRREAGLEPGCALEIGVRDGTIEIKPAALRVRFERHGNVTVAVPLDPVATMTTEDVRRVQDRLRTRRQI